MTQTILTEMTSESNVCAYRKGKKQQPRAHCTSIFVYSNCALIWAISYYCIAPYRFAIERAKGYEIVCVHPA